MRSSELFILYLATAAPFGAAYFMRVNVVGAKRPALLLRAAAASMLWPLTAIFYLLKHARPYSRSAVRYDSPATGDARGIEEAKRALVNALREIEDLLKAARVVKDEAQLHPLFEARECVERYVGLTLVAVGACAGAEPSKREMELFRIAGRVGEDLSVAGRCIHRRNVSRLLAHRERACTEMLHALAEVRESACGLCDLLTHAAARRVSEKLLRTFARAVELHSLLDDPEAATRMSRLLDAECARLRRLEEKGMEAAAAVSTQGVEPCTQVTLVKAPAM